ncbi:MAG TPA: GDP-mannose 4,6-dehydratase [Thermoanaerobaculia bacterium]|nr:GDP-mannose 4,6-dehydratase [Thermoanaerobaculia bacterium]
MSPRPVLITGGCGFIGTNMAHRVLSSGRHVRVFDDLSRPGVKQNLEWLRATHGAHLDVVVADVRFEDAVRTAVHDSSEIYHFAAQVAVTRSLDSPLHDFEVNARGTLNLLEALREMSHPSPLLFSSTNKVYGGLDDVGFHEGETRYEPRDSDLRSHGIGEKRPLSFHSPYGCSKGTADQYVLDYSRSYKLPAVVFRMSCIYGPHQFGTEDQGWVAHFMIQAMSGRTVTLFGDGKQVRDLLFIEDLLDAFVVAQESMTSIGGEAFNIGGGPANSISLVELLRMAESIGGKPIDLSFERWRTGDQKYYVSDTRRFQAATGWSPRTGVEQGVKKLYEWLAAHRGARAHSESE